MRKRENENNAKVISKYLAQKSKGICINEINLNKNLHLNIYIYT